MHRKDTGFIENLSDSEATCVLGYLGCPRIVNNSCLIFNRGPSRTTVLFVDTHGSAMAVKGIVRENKLFGFF